MTKPVPTQPIEPRARIYSLLALIGDECQDGGPVSEHALALVSEDLRGAALRLFPVPSWAAPLGNGLIDWPELYHADRPAYDKLRQRPSECDFNALYWQAGLSRESTAVMMAPDSLFMAHMEKIARLLTAMLEQGFFLVRLRPEYFLFHEEKIHAPWQALEKAALTSRHRRLEKAEVGWMHVSLRGLELPHDCEPGALVAHAYAYFLLHTLTRLPPALNQGALLEQIDGFRLYNPFLPPELRDVFRRYLQLPAAEKTGPLQCWQEFADACRRAAADPSPVRSYEIGGDSVYGRCKRNNENEDEFFSICDENTALVGVADGVSTADLGSGWHASNSIKRCLTDNRSYWLERLRDIGGADDPGEAAQALAQDFFKRAHAAVLAEINRWAEPPEQSVPRKACATMASTLVLAVIHGSRATIAHLGDSRAYKFSAGKLIRLTEDHNRRLEHMRNSASQQTPYEPLGEGAAELTRVVGACEFSSDLDTYVERPQKLSFDHCILQPGDCLLLCSDGLSHCEDALFGEADMEKGLIKVMETHAEKPCREIARSLVLDADDRHGGDNITALILRPMRA